MSKKIEFQGLKFVCGCKILPPKGYSAITLFGTVYTRKSADEVLRYLQTNRGRIWAHHEEMHIYQANTFAFMKWFCFYLIYIWQFFKAWPFFMSWKQAYRTIPFEYEAFMKEDDLYCKTSTWRDYIRTNKVRKTIKFI